jgi:hypothetical protein
MEWAALLPIGETADHEGAGDDADRGGQIWRQNGPTPD